MAKVWTDKEKAEEYDFGRFLLTLDARTRELLMDDHLREIYAAAKGRIVTAAGMEG